MKGVNQGGGSSDNKLMTNIATDIVLSQALQAKTKEAASEALTYEENEDSEDVISQWREKRLKELQQQSQKIQENITMRGHGEYREISQDEFLPSVTGSETVVCHFYHDDFQRCKILDQHLRVLASLHPETKFVSLNAEKAPFFVEKLTVRTLPTIVVFQNGVATERILGFEGISATDEFPTAALARCLIRKNAITRRTENEDSGSDSDS